MFDNLRDEANSFDSEEAKFQSASNTISGPISARSSRFLGMTSTQRFVIAVLLMAAVCGVDRLEGGALFQAGADPEHHDGQQPADGEWDAPAPGLQVRRIEGVLRVGRRESTRNIERRIAGGATPIGLAFAAPAIVLRMLTTLSPDERVMWIVWVWAIVLAPRAWRSVRSHRASTA